MAESSTAARPFEARLPCPVCIGAQMQKLVLGKPPKLLVLDHCTRCGGIWFERGEPQRLSWHPPAALWQVAPPRSLIIRPPCHGCGTPLDRDHSDCGACGRANEIACPSCDRPTRRVRTDGLTLDVCDSCKGAWFDHTELRSIWTLKFNEINRRGRTGERSALADGGSLLVESMIWMPDATFYAADTVISGAGNLLGAASDVVVAGGAADAASGILGAAGDAAESVFEAVAEILGGLFN
jgi:Zn-finger nucleic acid-binding protein